MTNAARLSPYASSLAGTLLSAREAVMAPIRPVLRAGGMTDQQWRVLRVLVDQGELEPSRLAEAALLHAPSVTRILRELVERRLVARQVDGRDGRRSIIRITAEGHDLVERTAAHTLRLLDAYTDRFGVERLAALQRELAALVEVIAPLQPTD